MTLVDDILAIENDCFDRPWTFETLSFEIHSPLCVMSYEQIDGKPVCYALGRVVAGEAELLRMGTLPQYRKMGFADKTLRKFIELLQGQSVESCFLEVRSRNIAAISLYQKHGFAKVGFRKKYYGDDDAVVMALKAAPHIEP